LGAGISAECSGANEVDAMACLGNIAIDMRRDTYWHPDFPRFPAVDAVLFVPNKKTVFYIQVTVAQEHDVSSEELMTIHEAAKKSLEKSTNATDWSFQYVAVTHSRRQAEKLELTDGGRLLSAQSVGEVTISKGYVKYAMK
jgi:hypothetical protein